MAATKALDRHTLSPEANRFFDETYDSPQIAVVDNVVDASEYVEEWKQQAEQQKRDAKSAQVLHYVTEGAELVAAIGSGGLATVAPWVNYLVGGIAKAVSAASPEPSVVRSVATAGKTLLHGQMAITTHNLIRGKVP